jgi:hypothetical protein
LFTGALKKRLPVGLVAAWTIPPSRPSAVPPPFTQGRLGYFATASSIKANRQTFEKAKTSGLFPMQHAMGERPLVSFICVWGFAEVLRFSVRYAPNRAA